MSGWIQGSDHAVVPSGAEASWLSESGRWAITSTWAEVALLGGVEVSEIAPRSSGALGNDIGRSRGAIRSCRTSYWERREICSLRAVVACRASSTSCVSVGRGIGSGWARDWNDCTDVLRRTLNGEGRENGDRNRAVVARWASSSLSHRAVTFAWPCIAALGVHATSRAVVTSVAERCDVSHPVRVAVVPWWTVSALR